MGAEPYTCELDPDTHKTLKLFLFKNTKNVEAIRANVTSGSWPCAVVKPALIVDPLQVAVAANRAAVSEKNNTMVTRSVFAEILYNLSLTKNITQSLSKFGIEQDENLIVCFLITKEADVSNDILPLIEGEPVPIGDLKHYTSLKDVKSVYKLNHLKSEECLLDVIVSRMVTKNFVSH